MPPKDNRPLTVAKALILGGAIAAIVVAFPVIAQYTGLTVDITRVPERLNHDEVSDYQFQTNVLAQLQHLTWAVDKIEREEQPSPFPVKDSK